MCYNRHKRIDQNRGFREILVQINWRKCSDSNRDACELKREEYFKIEIYKI